MPAIGATHEIEGKSRKGAGGIDALGPCEGCQGLVATVEEGNGDMVAAGRAGRLAPFNPGHKCFSRSNRSAPPTPAANLGLRRDRLANNALQVTKT